MSNFLKPEYNFYAIRREQIYNNLSLEKKEKLQKLSKCSWIDIKPIIIKRNKDYPEIGDIFEYKPNKEITLYGLVINNYIKYKYDRNDNLGWIIIIIFSPNAVDNYKKISEITKDELLIYPNIVSDLHWKKGYFKKIDHIDSYKLKFSYGFNNFYDGTFRNDEGVIMKKKPDIFEQSGVFTEFGLSFEVLYQLIVKGIDFDLPIKNY